MNTDKTASRGKLSAENSESNKDVPYSAVYSDTLLEHALAEAACGEVDLGQRIGIECAQRRSWKAIVNVGAGEGASYLLSVQIFNYLMPSSQMILLWLSEETRSL